MGERRQRLIGPHVERSQDHGPLAHRRGDLFEDGDLFIFRRQAIGAEEKKLAPQQADPVGAGCGGSPCIIDAGGVAADFDPAAVTRHGRLSICGSLGRWAHGGDHLSGRIDQEGAIVAVEQYHLTTFDRLEQAGNADDRGQAQGSSQDRGVGGGASLLGGETEDEGAIETSRLRRREIPRHHDRRLQRRWRRTAGAMQRASELSDHILDIGRARLKYRIR